MRRGAILVIAALLGPVGARAQLEGVIVSDIGLPVPDARVEAWSATTRLSVKVSDAEGKFVFPVPQSAFAIGIVVRTAGYEPARRSFARGARKVKVRIAPLAASVAEVAAWEARALCPNRESAAARRAWESLRRRYEGGVAISRYAQLEQWLGLVSRYRLRDIESEYVQPAARGTTSYGMAEYDSALARMGYVSLTSPATRNTDYGPWLYPVLEADQAQHFVQPYFGEHHTLSVEIGTGDETVLVFCPRDRAHPGLEGALRIAADGSPAVVRWSFWNPDRLAVPAGGQVMYAPWDRAMTPALLLPASGLFWRRSKSGDYFTRFTQYAHWSVDAAADSLLGCRGRCAPRTALY